MDLSIKTIDECISTYPEATQAILQKVRKTIHEAAPEAKEKIAYGIPTFTLNGNLVHFSAYRAHIGFYPGAEAIAVFKDELKDYDTSKGTVRFPIDQPIPYDLIKKITEFRVEQSLTR